MKRVIAVALCIKRVVFIKNQFFISIAQLFTFNEVWLGVAPVWPPSGLVGSWATRSKPAADWRTTAKGGWMDEGPMNE